VKQFLVDDKDLSFYLQSKKMLESQIAVRHRVQSTMVLWVLSLAIFGMLPACITQRESMSLFHRPH